MPRSLRELPPGERVLVLGASGVVGTIAVQAAKLLGAGEVVAAARDEAGLAKARERGADVTVRIGAEIRQLPEHTIDRRQVSTMDRFSLLAVIAAHDAALRILPRRHHLTGQLALMLLMVGYTFTGLYLLFGG